MTLVVLAINSLPAQADEASGEIYSSLRAGVASTKIGDNSERTADVVSRFSRVGAKGEANVNDELSAFGHYEWEADIVNSNNNGANLKTRLGYVGLKGDWGSFRVGQDYHTFYNFNVGAGDIPWNYSGFAQVDYRGRTSETVTYEGEFGITKVGASFVLDGEAGDDVDQTELGISFDGGVATVALAGIIDSAAGADNTAGLAVNGSVGAADWYVGFQDKGNTSSVTFDITAHDLYFHTEQFNSGVSGGADPTLYTIGYTHGLGKNASVWFEYGVYDDDVDASTGDEQNIEVIFKYDISGIF